MITQAEKIKRNYEKMKSQRVNWDDHWEQTLKYVMPRKDDVFTKGNLSPGEKKNFQVYDSTAIISNHLLAAALHGTLTNPASAWFDFSSGDSDLDKSYRNKQWLQKAARKTLLTMNRSNFQTEIHETYLDLGATGTGFVSAIEDPTYGVIYSSKPIYQAYVAESHVGIIDTVYLHTRMTLRQVSQKYGNDNFSETLKYKMITDPMEKVEVVQAIYPREDGDRLGLFSNTKPVASMHVMIDPECILLKESGYDEMPFCVPRWNKTSAEMYGRGPGMEALPDIKMLNEVRKTTIRGAQKVVDPILLAPDDGVMLPIRSTPGAINYYRAGTQDRIESLNLNTRVDFGFQMIEDLKSTIGKHFFIDQFQLNEGPQMTATEVIQRTEEKLRTMGPVLGRLNFELLRPIIDRTFGILLRAGEFGPMSEVPSDLRGRNIEIRYSSQISKAQRATEADNITRLLQVVQPFLGADIQAMDNFDVDEIIRHSADVFGVRQEILRSPDALAAMREERENQQAEMMEAQKNNLDSESVKNVSSAML